MPATIPVLPATNIEQGAQFYSRLGFVEDGRAADYLSLVHPLGIELHLHLEGRWGVGGSAHSGAAYIRFDSGGGSATLRYLGNCRSWRLRVGTSRHALWIARVHARRSLWEHDQRWGSIGALSRHWSTSPDTNRANSEQAPK